MAWPFSIDLHMLLDLCGSYVEKRCLQRVKLHESNLSHAWFFPSSLTFRFYHSHNTLPLPLSISADKLFTLKQVLLIEISLNQWFPKLAVPPPGGL
jgi:hypothetical protein